MSATVWESSKALVATHLLVSLRRRVETGRRGESTGLGCRSRQAFKCTMPVASSVHQFRNLPTKPVADLPWFKEMFKHPGKFPFPTTIRRKPVSL